MAEAGFIAAAAPRVAGASHAAIRHAQAVAITGLFVHTCSDGELHATLGRAGTTHHDDIKSLRGARLHFALAVCKCNITMTDPQAQEDIVCRAAVSEKSATFHFVKFVNPEAAKLNHARPYKKDQQLLTFERGVSSRRPNTIRTVWHSLRTMDGKRPVGGVRFVPAKRA